MGRIGIDVAGAQRIKGDGQAIQCEGGHSHQRGGGEHVMLGAPGEARKQGQRGGGQQEIGDPEQDVDKAAIKDERREVMHQCPSARPKQDADDEEGELAIHAGRLGRGRRI